MITIETASNTNAIYYLFIQKKNLQQNNTNEFNLEYVVSKKIFSEFNLGLKFFFRKIIKKISFFDILIEKIKMNSRLKKFIFMRKIFRKKLSIKMFPRFFISCILLSLKIFIDKKVYFCQKKLI